MSVRTCLATTGVRVPASSTTPAMVSTRASPSQAIVDAQAPGRTVGFVLGPVGLNVHMKRPDAPPLRAIVFPSGLSVKVGLSHTADALCTRLDAHALAQVQVPASRARVAGGAAEAGMVADGTVPRTAAAAPPRLPPRPNGESPRGSMVSI